MPWRNTCPMDERLRFIEDWLRREWTMLELCRLYGISRPTGYKWVERFTARGELGLSDEKRAPRAHPNATPTEVESAITAMRLRYPHWGPRKIRHRLGKLHPAAVWPASSTIGEILKRRGMVVPRVKRRRVPLYNLSMSPGMQPNDVWAADFKGWFCTADGTRIDPLTVTDAASRYLIRCRAVDSTDGETVRGQFTAAFQEFGLPSAMRTDNGPPFASRTVAGLSRLSVWLIRLGVTPERIRPGHPEENGAHERMHKTLKAQTAKPPRASLKAQQAAFDRFQEEYNDERPHESLDMRTPSEVYQPSRRSFPNRIPEIEYPREAKVYKVSTNGCIKPGKATDVFVSNALVGERIGLIQTNDTDWTVYFSSVKLGTYNSKQTKIGRV